MTNDRFDGIAPFAAFHLGLATTYSPASSTIGEFLPQVKAIKNGVVVCHCRCHAVNRGAPYI
jgi:hypothetical protein